MFTISPGDAVYHEYCSPVPAKYFSGLSDSVYHNIRTAREKPSLVSHSHSGVLFTGSCNVLSGLSDSVYYVKHNKSERSLHRSYEISGVQYSISATLPHPTPPSSPSVVPQVLFGSDGCSVVYPCHSLVVDMDVKSGRQHFFIGHTDKVGHSLASVHICA